jgi:NAD(P)-dependent dehydrogenase (short-subunit alcohol dehydrogenase family)
MRTILVTGATRGLGLSLARALDAHDDVSLVLGVRDLEAGRDVAKTLRRAEAALLDTGALASIRAFVARWDRPLHALVHNAGIQETADTTFTAEGVETTFAVNHLGPLALTLGLAPHVRGGRVVMLGSGTHNPDNRTATMFGFRGGRFTSLEAHLRGECGRFDRSPARHGSLRDEQARRDARDDVARAARRAHDVLHLRSGPHARHRPRAHRAARAAVGVGRTSSRGSRPSCPTRAPPSARLRRSRSSCSRARSSLARSTATTARPHGACGRARATPSSLRASSTRASPPSPRVVSGSPHRQVNDATCADREAVKGSIRSCATVSAGSPSSPRSCPSVPAARIAGSGTTARGRVNPWGPTRRVRERVECYCPEGYICHEDRFPPDAALPDADLDAGAASATHDASDATPADTRLDGSVQDTMVSEDGFVTQDAMADGDGGGVTEIDGGP